MIQFDINIFSWMSTPAMLTIDAIGVVHYCLCESLLDFILS